MPIHDTGISTKSKERMFNVIVKVKREVIEYYQMDQWAEDHEDAEALTTNYVSDGHLGSGDLSEEMIFEQSKKTEIIGVYVEVG